MEAGPILSVRGLAVAYATATGVKAALRNVSFDVARGEALAIVGESGSGKSTIALSILGLAADNARITSDGILFDNEEIGCASDARRTQLRGARIGTVFQDPFTSLNPALPVGFQVAEPLIHHRAMDRDRAMARASELLDEVGMADAGRVSRSYPHQLSGGMQQRALIAMALACEPTLLLLDEPTTALDVTVEAQILSLLERLKRERGLSVLFITHNLGIVRRFCDRVCVLYAGEVIEYGPVGDILVTPRHPYTKGLVASSPRVWSEQRLRLQSIGGKTPENPQAVVGCVFRERCPFAEGRCREPQALLSPDGDHAVRCWKSAALTGTAWPAPPVAASHERSRRADDTLVEVRSLRKEFDVGGSFGTIAIKRPPGRLPRLESTTRKIVAVDGVSLSIAAGEVLGVVGESGSGKSTLGRSMLRLVEPSSGDIALRGRDITRLPQRELKSIRRELQIILQNPDSSLNPRKSVEDAIGRSITLFEGLRGKRRRARVEELLALVELPTSYCARFPHQLSGGEKQRVGIARALASSPSLIVCDEAVSALDVSLQAAVLNLLLDMRDRLGLAYLFISHDLSVIAYLADRIAVMYRGRIVELGSKHQVLHPPFHPYTRMLLASVPSLTAAPSMDACAADARWSNGRRDDTSATAADEHSLVEVAPGHWIAGAGHLCELGDASPLLARAAAETGERN